MALILNGFLHKTNSLLNTNPNIYLFSKRFANIAQETLELETSLIFFQSICWDRYLSFWYRPIISTIAIPVPLRIGFTAWKTLQKAKKKSHFLQCKWIAIELPPQHLRWTHIFPPPPQFLRTEVYLWGLNFGNEIFQAHYRFCQLGVLVGRQWMCQQKNVWKSQTISLKSRGYHSDP